MRVKRFLITLRKLKFNQEIWKGFNNKQKEQVLSEKVIKKVSLKTLHFRMEANHKIN